MSAKTISLTVFEAIMLVTQSTGKTVFRDDIENYNDDSLEIKRWRIVAIKTMGEFGMSTQQIVRYMKLPSEIIKTLKGLQDDIIIISMRKKVSGEMINIIKRNNDVVHP